MKLHPCLTGKSRVKVSKNVLKTVSRVLKKMQPSMYKGQRGFTCDETYLEEIVQTIRARKGVSSANCINFLSKLVDYSNRELDWGVPPIPREPLPLFHKNNCSLESFEDYLCLENVLKDFYSELESPIPDSADDRIWQILLSAISHDSILEKRWLKPLLKALSKGINLSGSWLWLELEGEKRCTSENLHSWHARKRWIADPLTHFLITRWIDKFPEDRKALKNFDILGAIKKCRHLQKHRRIRTVGGLLKLAKARAYYVLPDFLVDYASGSLPAVCVDKYTWARIMDDKRVHYPEQRMQADLQPVDAAILKRPPVVSGEFDPDIQIELFKELLRKKFWEKIKKEGTEEEHVTSPEEARVILKSFLDKNHGDLSQTFILLVKWARQLLSDKKHIFEQRRKSKPLKVSSVKTYLHNIGDGLLNCASNIDLLKLKDLKREKVYGDAILYKKTYGSRFHAAEQLEQFHGFLWVFYRRISANFDSIRIEVDLPPINVNAFIITPVEYKKILKLLGWEQQLLNIWQKMRIVATILGCKTDLRQSEIVSIRLVDFQDGAEPYIQIRNNEFNHLKTKDSARQIPLASLLDDDELQFIKDFYAFRAREAELIGGELLLCDPLSGFGCVTYSQLLQPVVDAMRTVTGDPRLSFHSLRHSFVTWSLVRLLLRDDFDPGPSLECLNDPFFDKQKLERLRHDLLTNERQGRNYLYATATLVGHASPSTTICSYFHLMDLVLGYFLRHPLSLPELSVKAIQEVAGVSQSQAYKFKERKCNLADIVQSVSKTTSDRSTTKITYKRGRTPKISTEKTSDFLMPWETSLTKHLDISERKLVESKHTEKTIPVPKEQSDILFAAELYQKISMLDGRVWPKVNRTLSRAKCSYKEESSSFVIDDPRLGKELIDALAILGVDKEHLLLIYRPNLTKNKRSRKIDLQSWAKGLGIDREHFDEATNSSDSPPGRGNILFNIRKKQEIIAGEDIENMGSESLIYLMEMVEIGKLKPV